ncbi:hypothetical protein BGX23_007360 [Mortierella sp. AD031]|nr:hypothetical protein BGX23_007360 [Mortierella sp. AD031]
MADVTGLKPFHPGLTEGMEGVHESDSPILTTQEAEVGLETGVFPAFVTVSRSGATYWLMFLVAHFGHEYATVYWVIEDAAKHEGEEFKSSSESEGLRRCIRCIY